MEILGLLFGALLLCGVIGFLGGLWCALVSFFCFKALFVLADGIELAIRALQLRPLKTWSLAVMGSSLSLLFAAAGMAYGWMQLAH